MGVSFYRLSVSFTLRKRI